MENKVVLITGGTGSFGEALTNELLKLNPQVIRVLSNDEDAMVSMQRKYENKNLRFLVGDVRDKARLYRAMNGVDIVIHSAALKHVPICDFNPFEAVKTNILGSMNVVDAAIDNMVCKVLAISSDKAVHPINLYGSTKLTMEKLFIQADVYGKTKFSCVRFGNFQESRGSLMPLIRQQLEAGEIITITDKEMARFWITLEDAARFTVACLNRMEGKEIFIPKMPEKQIAEIIEALAPNAPYKIIGKRQGEKLHELLWSEGEEPQDMGDYLVIK